MKNERQKTAIIFRRKTAIKQQITHTDCEQSVQRTKHRRYLCNIVAVGALIFVTAGCTISDDDRCVKGYEWDTTYQLCLKIEPEEIETDEIDTEPQLNGVGTLCTTDTECTALALEVDFCVINPLSPDDGGICSVSNCVPEDCGGPHACCDCTGIDSTLVRTDVPFCVPESRVSLIEGSLECTCN